MVDPALQVNNTYVIGFLSVRDQGQEVTQPLEPDENQRNIGVPLDVQTDAPRSCEEKNKYIPALLLVWCERPVPSVRTRVRATSRLERDPPRAHVRRVTNRIETFECNCQLVVDRANRKVTRIFSCKCRVSSYFV
ncbi:hypothetical protein ACJJTC_001257 [Scirpophaga incertulas]